MQLMTPEQRDELLDTFERDAFHLELKDYYAADYEHGPIARWRRGEPDDYAWLQPWLNRVREAAKAGRTVRRVRVVTEPHSEYVRWLRSVTHLNIDAGEDIRWLPRHLVPADVAFPVDGSDWWLFDGRFVTVGHFDEQARVLGSELVTDPAVVASCATLRDRLWDLAVPHHEYPPA